ncbi:MAG: RNA-binding protein [Thermoanaerobaculia bacterium]
MTGKSAPPAAIPHAAVKDGDSCAVLQGTHKGKSGTVRDVKLSKTGHVTITVVQADGERFKALARNVAVGKRAG